MSCYRFIFMRHLKYFPCTVCNCSVFSNFIHSFTHHPMFLFICSNDVVENNSIDIELFACSSNRLVVVAVEQAQCVQPWASSQTAGPRSTVANLELEFGRNMAEATVPVVAEHRLCVQNEAVHGTLCPTLVGLQCPDSCCSESLSQALFKTQIQISNSR